MLKPPALSWNALRVAAESRLAIRYEPARRSSKRWSPTICLFIWSWAELRLIPPDPRSNYCAAMWTPGNKPL